jgi:predicted TIM-barrel fold metal-dependent hydrolase
MDAQGIDMAVLSVNVPGVDWFSAADAPAIAREVNDELSSVVAARPDRLAYMAAVPMQAPEAAAAELQRAVGAGAVGAMIYSNVAGDALDDRRFEVVFDAAAELDVPLYVHPTYPLSAATLQGYALIPTLGFLVDTTAATLRLVLGGLYERHPGFKLILAHAASLIPQLVGRIDYEAERAPGGRGASSVALSERLALLYTDTVCVWPPALRSALDLVGPERMLLGSDYPFWDPARTFEALAAAGLDDRLRARIGAQNARELFGSGSR